MGKKVSPPNSGRSSHSAKDSANSSATNSAKNSARSTGRSARSSAKSSNVSSARGVSGSTVPRNKKPTKSMKEPAKVRGQRARPSSNTNSEGSFSSRSSARSHGSRSSRISARSKAKKAVNPKEVNLSTTGSSMRGQRRANTKKPGVPRQERKQSTNARATRDRTVNAKKSKNAEPKSRISSRKSKKETEKANLAMALQQSFEAEQRTAKPKSEPKAKMEATKSDETDAEKRTKAIKQSLMADSMNEGFDVVRVKGGRRETNLRKEYVKKDLRDAAAMIKKRQPFNAAAKRRAAIQGQMDLGQDSATEKSASKVSKKTSARNSKAPMRRAAVQKENDSRQPVSTSRIASKSKSVSNAIPRGIELGANSKKIQEGDAPKGMDDYRERERARRAQRSKGAKGSKLTASAPRQKKQKPVAYEAPKKKMRKDSEVPTKQMSRMQIRKGGGETKIRKDGVETHTSVNVLGGNRVDKPVGAKDLASKRAAYFESLLQNQE